MTHQEIKPLIRASEIAEVPQPAFHHPYNDNCEISGVRLSFLAGLERTGVSLVRVPPGKDSTCYHNHTCEEEWMYILSGKGIAHIDDEEHEIGPGDFMGFRTPSVAHMLHNNGGEDLVYLVGGENREVEIAEFPRLGKRMIRHGKNMDIYPESAREDFPLKFDET
ncbi:MAG: cupin domain-containing protein [Acidobacteriota bacterium]|nr:cupin domain-containing protein [Acidobacteriota bacterium]